MFEQTEYSQYCELHLSLTFNVVHFAFAAVNTQVVPLKRD